MNQAARKAADCNGNACARSILALSAQLEFAVQEADAPVEELGRTIGQLAALLRDLSHESSVESGDIQDSKVDEIRDELYTSIVRMQFYDRLVQHITNIREYLNCIAEAAGNGTPQGLDEHGLPEDPAWEELRRAFRGKLMSHEQRRQLDEILPPPDGRTEDEDASAEDEREQGSIELF